MHKLAMPSSTASPVLMLLPIFLLFLFLVPNSSATTSSYCGTQSLPQSDIDLLDFPLNLEYLEAEFFLFGAFGYGLDKVAPELTGKGPSPVGARKANLSPLINDITAQFAFQEVGHLRFHYFTSEFFFPLNPTLHSMFLILLVIYATLSKENVNQTLASVPM